VELLAVQNCFLKEIFGNNCTLVRREEEELYFLLSLFKGLKGLLLLSSIYSDPYINFLICGSGEHPRQQQVKFISKQTILEELVQSLLPPCH